MANGSGSDFSKSSNSYNSDSASNADNAGDMFERLRNFNSIVSKEAAHDAANAEIELRMNEVNNYRKAHPTCSVFVTVFMTFFKRFEDNAEQYKFVNMVIDYQKSNAFPYIEITPGQSQFSVVHVYRPLANRDLPRTEKSVPAWELRYNGVFLNELINNGSAIGALRVLNGSSMYDILRMLSKLGSDSSNFNRLYSLCGTAEGVGRSRLLVAFAVVMASWKSSAALNILQERMSDIAKLPLEQQKDIVEFLGGGTTTDVKKEIVGKWRVKVGKWTWRYTFDKNNNVSWLDQGNGRSGHGRWKEDGDRIKTTWPPSKTIEYWKLPICPSGQTGTAIMAEGSFDLVAEKL